MASLGQNSVLAFPLGGDPPSQNSKIPFDQLAGVDVVPVRLTNGKFTIQWDSTNNPIFGDDLSHAVLSLIYERKGLWAADSTGQRGSLLYTVKNDRKSTPSQIAAYALDAIQPLIDLGRIIVDPTTGVQATRVKPGRIDLVITYRTPGGTSPVTVRAAFQG